MGFVIQTEIRQKVGELVIMHWNAQGLSNIKKNKKLWQSMDIVMFQETFIEEKNIKKIVENLDNGFEWKGKAATRINKKGRASGGFFNRHQEKIRKNMERGGMGVWA